MHRNWYQLKAHMPLSIAYLLSFPSYNDLLVEKMSFVAILLIPVLFKPSQGGSLGPRLWKFVWKTSLYQTLEPQGYLYPALKIAWSYGYWLWVNSTACDGQSQTDEYAACRALAQLSAKKTF